MIVGGVVTRDLYTVFEKVREVGEWGGLMWVKWRSIGGRGIG